MKTELRIGNLLLSDGCEVEVEGIDKYHEVTTTANFKGSCNGNLRTIPLTEGWLIKFGFKNLTNAYKSKKVYIQYTQNKCFQLYLIGIDKAGNASLIDFNLEIKYVHQLQNLYFALIGEELVYTQAGGV